MQTARNDALLQVAEAYFNVQQARGHLAGAEDSVQKARSLVKTVRSLSAGLVAPIEINRAQTLLVASSNRMPRPKATGGRPVPN